MNPNEHQLRYPWGDQQPEPGRALEVAPGVKWVRMPLPFALDHINVWLLRDRIDGRDGWTLIDCGVSREEIRTRWEQVFDNELDGLPVLRVLVTHMHPDHIGLADWLCKRWNAPLWISMTDYMTAAFWSSRTEGSGPNGQAAVAHFTRHGLSDPDALDKIRQRAGYYPDLVPAVPAQYVRLMHGEHIRIGEHHWEVIVGYGHAPEHVSLYSPAHRVLISGDMVLPRISTNVSVFNYEPEADPLRLYLQSLHAYAGLPADVLVLPSHGRVFRGLHERIAQQHRHHAERLAEVVEACAQPRSAADIVPVLFKRQLDTHQLTFAMGEAIAHLHALYFEDKLHRQSGDDGVLRFVAA